MNEAFRLTEGDRMQPVWAKLKAHMQKRLDDARRSNDGTSLNEVQTAVLRGRIAECRAFVELDAVRPIIED